VGSAQLAAAVSVEEKEAPSVLEAISSKRIPDLWGFKITSTKSAYDKLMGVAENWTNIEDVPYFAEGATVTFAAALAWFLVVMQVFVLPIKKMSLTFWLAVANRANMQKMLPLLLQHADIIQIILPDHVKSWHPMCVIAYMIVGGMSIESFNTVVQLMNSQSATGMTSEQKKILDDAQSARMEIRKAKRILQEREREARKRFNEDMKNLSKIQTELTSIEKPFVESFNQLAGNLTMDDKKHLLEKHRAAAAKARREESNPPAPFTAVLARAQAAKRDGMARQVKTLLSQLPGTKEVLGCIQEVATEATDILQRYCDGAQEDPSASVDVEEDSSEGDDADPDLFDIEIAPMEDET